MSNRLKEMRGGAGLTLQEVADRVGSTKEQIWRLESGRRGLTLEWMRRLAVALECAPSDLLDDQDFAPRLKGAEIQLVEDFRSMSPANRERFMSIMMPARAALQDAEAPHRSPREASIKDPPPSEQPPRSNGP